MSLADKKTAPDPDARAPVPPHLMAAVAEAFAIGRWKWDAESGEIDLLNDTLDARNAPRKLYSKSKVRTPSMARLDSWLQTCKEGDSALASFTLRDDPVAVRVFCLGRTEKSAWGLVQDCTAETLNVENDQRFRMALMGAAHGIALVGLDGAFMQVNESLCRMLGYSEEELRTRTFQDVTHPDDLEIDLDHLHECVEGMRTTYQMEKRYFRKDGGTIWVNLAVSILRAENNTPLYFISQIQDITARKQAEEQLVAARDEAKNASAAKSAFLASMSHEIRTPMTGVMGMLDMLTESGVSGDQLDLIKTARSSAEMLLSIINDVLDMAKLEAGRVEIAKRDFDAEKLLHTVCDMMAGRAEAKGLRFNAVLPLSTRIWLKGDPDRISQILFNILGNAVKFTDAGEVSLAAETRPTDAGLDLVMKVTDTGRGIPADKTESIFREFERVQDEAGARVEGTGLGLAIVSRLVGAMDGRIEVQSEPGKGSCFTVTLPLAAGTAPAEAIVPVAPVQPATPPPVGVETKGAKAPIAVLVVEDNAVNRKVIGSVLAIAGIEPVYAFDGQQALDAVREAVFDVVFMDVMMPVMDGLTATRKLREMGFAAPILGLTANAMQHHREACFEAGMDDHIAKPFRPADILTALKKHVGDHAKA
ncbi:PAS domain S-box protein [Parvibaculum sp.]|uniref:PAS domain S-box protein n=1 Tax=Parvibaculum sp. TaxID=2024848 RepID=UPI00391D1DF0